MNTTTQRNGSCLCGAIHFSVTPKSSSIEACHCNICRKWGGGPLLATACESDINIEGEEYLALYSSSDWAERGFCQQCGTHLFYRLKQGEHYAIPVGVFDNSEHWQLNEQIFIDEKPDFYSFAEKTRDLTGAEVLAQFLDDEH